MLIYIIRFIICFISPEKAHWGRGQLSYLFIYVFIYDLFICLFVLFIISLKSRKTITNPQTSLQAAFTFGKKLCGDETSIALSVLADVSLTSDGSASSSFWCTVAVLKSRLEREGLVSGGSTTSSVFSFPRHCLQIAEIQ